MLWEEIETHEEDTEKQTLLQDFQWTKYLHIPHKALFVQRLRRLGGIFQETYVGDRVRNKRLRLKKKEKGGEKIYRKYFFGCGSKVIRIWRSEPQIGEVKRLILFLYFNVEIQNENTSLFV